MQAGIFRVAIQDRHKSAPHPHVVIIEFSGDKDCLVVPAFSLGGEWLESYLDALDKQQLRRDQAFVEMDNAEHCDFDVGFTPGRAAWLVERFRRITKSDLRRCDRIGKMKDSGMELIVDGLLKLAEAKSERFSGAILKKLRRLRARCTE